MNESNTMTFEISRPKDGAISRDSECKKPGRRRKPGLAQMPLKMDRCPEDYLAHFFV